MSYQLLQTGLPISEIEDVPMIATTLQECLEEGLISHPELQDLLNLDRSSVYRYISGQTPLRYDQIRVLVKHIKSPHARSRILTDLLSGTPFVATYIESDLDINGDGDINTRDAIASTAKICEEAASMLNGMLGAMDSPSYMTEENRDIVNGRCDQLIQYMMSVKLIAEHECQRRLRRQCKPLTIGGQK